MGFYTDKKILITGGTGTIGQQLVLKLLQEKPTVIRVFSRDEHKQFEMQQTLFEHTKVLRYLIGDVRDKDRLTRAMEGIDYVFHLAAMKHVPACEYNPFEAVQTNVIGTQNVIQAAIECKVKKVLFTSSDKAISPTNTYGATKLMAERLISASEYQKGPKKTSFASVRFGNVMGSRGSVIPLFVKQITEYKKIMITNKSMTRYMMTPFQAVRLLLEANEISQGGEVFVLKMPIVRLLDLSHIIIEEITRRKAIREQVIIEEVGLRPGEKIDEELMTVEEYKKVVETPLMYIIPPSFAHKGRTYKTSHSAHLTGDIPYAANEIIHKEKLREWLNNENLLG